MHFLLGLSLCLLSLQLSADSNIKGPKYASMLSSFSKLSAQNQKRSSLIKYGQSVGGRDLFLIKILKKDFKSNILQRKAILITGAHHGWEYLNIADRVPGWLISKESNLMNKFIEEGGVIYIVPVVNPDGYERRRRYNNNNFDLNRDYPLPLVGHIGSSQPEIKNLLDFLLNDLKKDNSRIKMNLNYHCCGYRSNAEFLFPWAHKTEEVQDALFFKELAKKVEGIFQHKDITSGQWAKVLYTRNGTATDYFYSVHNAPAYNFEGSWGKENLRFEEHKKMIELLISSIPY